VSTLDPERSDVFNTIRKDFDVAGVVQSDEQILGVMNELMLKAAKQMLTRLRLRPTRRVERVGLRRSLVRG
jgi:hypothetical protein